MKLYIIRHAPTEANLVGKMVNGYTHLDIIYNKENNSDIISEWESKVGVYIPKAARKIIVSSPARRCIQTSDFLFGGLPRWVTRDLEELDCSALGDKKFWEVSQEEFEKLVHISPTDMQTKVRKIRKLGLQVEEQFGVSSCVMITHGMVARYLYSYAMGEPETSAYDVINSKKVKFSNLDLMTYDTCKGKVAIHPFTDPIDHKSE